MYSRREILKATGASGGALSMAGCLGNIQLFGESNGDNDDQDHDQNQQDQDESDSSGQSGHENDEDGTTTDDDNKQPAPADPQTDPDNMPDDDEYASDEKVSESQPTTDDVTISDDELTTQPSGATVTGTLTNEGETTLDVVDIQVTFLDASGQPLTTTLWGTNNLGPGESWNFEVSADGSEYSDATDYEIAVLL